MFLLFILKDLLLVEGLFISQNYFWLLGGGGLLCRRFQSGRL